MEEITDKALKREVKKYRELLGKLKSEIIPVGKNLAERAAFMVPVLTKLEAHIQQHGVVDEYQNGANQKGRKRSVEFDAYIALVRCYALTMRALVGNVPKEESEDEEGGHFE